MHVAAALGDVFTGFDGSVDRKHVAVGTCLFDRNHRIGARGKHAAGRNAHRRRGRDGIDRRDAHANVADDLERTRGCLRNERETVHHRTRGVGILVVSGDRLGENPAQRLVEADELDRGRGDDRARKERHHRLTRREQSFDRESRRR